MRRLPIVEHDRDRPPGRAQRRAEALAAELTRREPHLALPEELRPLAPHRLEEAPALILDDLSGIPLLDRLYESTFLEDRVRLRAGDGDFVASRATAVAGYEDYCRTTLGLGRPTWLRPRGRLDTAHLASACITDRVVRHVLVEALRAGELPYVHPEMGVSPIWEMAALLRTLSHCPLAVIAPPPGLTAAVNDKLWFAATTARLLGRQRVPRTEEAWNVTYLAQRALELARSCHSLVIKVPAAAGGAGNVVLEAGQLRGRSLSTAVRLLKELLRRLGWRGEGHLLVGSWETEVLCCPSVQTWIWPAAMGEPVVEAVTVQALEGREGYFAGSHPAELPSALRREIVEHCWLLARLYQLLGYVGRCSFDLLLVGKDLASCRLQLLECNGRWGGASIPMTLMNRLFGDWRRRPYATGVAIADGLDRLTFADVLSHFGGDVFDAASNRGRFIFYCPGAMEARSGIEVLALGETWEEAHRAVTEEVPHRLRELVAAAG